MARSLRGLVVAGVAIALFLRALAPAVRKVVLPWQATDCGLHLSGCSTAGRARCSAAIWQATRFLSAPPACLAMHVKATDATAQALHTVRRTVPGVSSASWCTGLLSAPASELAALSAATLQHARPVSWRRYLQPPYSMHVREAVGAQMTGTQPAQCHAGCRLHRPACRYFTSATVAGFSSPHTASHITD